MNILSNVHTGGVQSGCAENGAAVSHHTQDVGLSELERLNKEIETVRHEVEQEKRRLSYYWVGQSGCSGSQNPSISTSERERKISDKNSYGLPISTGTTKMYSQTGKYVVDNSKPRTDLEYDPLSNFSAGLHPGAQPKVKNGHSLKKARYTEPDRIKPVACKASWPPRSPSPEPQDDLIEDGVLIIDIPSSPDAKGGKEQKLLDSGANKSLKERKLNKFKEVNCTSPRLAKPIASKVSSLSTNEYAEESSGQTICFENHKLDKRGNLSAEIDAKKIAESATISILPEPPIKRQENPFQVTLCQYEASYAAETSKLLQPTHFAPKNSLFYEAPVANSDLQCRQQRELPAQNSTAGGLLQGVAADDKAPPPSCLEEAEPSSSCRQNLAADKRSAVDCTQLSDSRLGEIICIKTSSDDEDNDELNYSELDLSDSDPMEECFRIFMEENNKDKGNELAQTPVSTRLTVMG